MRDLTEILRESSMHHRHLCPRQVLGARMALAAGHQLGLELPRLDKRLLVMAETDGCMVDGIVAATGCDVGKRTLHILDMGKVAATFTDIHTETSIRVSPALQSRALAVQYASGARNRWQAMLLGYQIMPAEELFVVQPVKLDMPLSQILSRPGRKSICKICQEEVINGREVINNGIVLCRTCAGEGYYHIPTQMQSPQEATVPIVSMKTIRKVMLKIGAYSR